MIIYFTGSLPKNGKTPFGGGEVGNVRTIRMLQSIGHKVITVRRLRSESKETKAKRLFAYPIRSLINASHWFFILLFGTRKNSVVHISGFYGCTIYIETIQTLIAKLLGYKIIYELRGGGAQKFYIEGNSFYRKQFLFIIKCSDYLFSQGLENEPFLKSLCNTPIFYYPNCVLQGFYPKEIVKKPQDMINIVYFGRIEKQKNPMLVIDVTYHLQKRYDNVTLTMIGDGQEDLVEIVRTQMNKKLQPNSYTILPGCQHEELRKLLPDKHFYIFPSEQPREGQSNAITEAMSFGIIPIASPQGFNRSTIGDDYLIIDELNVDSYASRISNIIDNKEINKYSQFVRNRFLDNFTEKKVFERLRVEYNSIEKTICH